MRAALAKRLDALEPRAPFLAVPNVITVPHDQTAADALARFRRDYAGRIPQHHGVIIVPACIASLADENSFASRFYSHQTQLVSNAKSALCSDVRDQEEG